MKNPFKSVSGAWPGSAAAALRLPELAADRRDIRLPVSTGPRLPGSAALFPPRPHLEQVAARPASCNSSDRCCSQTREERKKLEQQVTELHQIMVDQHMIVLIYWSAREILPSPCPGSQSHSSSVGDKE